MHTEGLSRENIDRLRQYDTPTVCNAIEVFAVRPRNTGYMDRRIKACFPELPPMVGYAATATLRTAAPARQGDVYSSLDQQVGTFAEVPGPPIVVYQDLDEPPEAASIGDVMCSTYKSFGAAGLITSGAARDLEQVRALEFPAFSNGVICSHGYAHTLELMVPVYVGGITVFPGDLVHADCNGVAIIPHEIAADLGHACAEFVAAEEVVLSYVNAGDPTPDGLAEARAECARMIGALGERVRKKQN